MRKLNIPKAMTQKAKLHEEELPVDTFVKLNRIALLMRIIDDDDKITALCKEYRDLLNNLK